MGPVAPAAGENTVTFNVDRVLRGRPPPRRHNCLLLLPVQSCRAFYGQLLAIPAFDRGPELSRTFSEYALRPEFLRGMRSGAQKPPAAKKRRSYLSLYGRNRCATRRCGRVVAFAVGSQLRDQNVAPTRWNVLGGRLT